MHCPGCDANVHEEAIFCHKCGHRVVADNENPESETGSDEEEIDSPERTAPTMPLSTPSAEGSRSPLGGGKQEEYQEEHLWTGRYSAKAMLGSAIAATLLTLLALTGVIMFHGNGWVWTLAIGMILLLWGFLAVRLLYRRLNVHYKLTTRRFIHETGILRRVTDRIEAIDIDDVNFEQGIFDRFVGVGTIRISSSDRSHPKLVLLGIENVKEVSETIDTARRKERERRGLYIESI